MTRTAKFFSLLFPAIFAAASFSHAQSDFQKIKDRVITELMDAKVEDANVAQLLTTIRADGAWPGINYEDVSRTGFEHRFHLSNMVSLARAYQTETSKYHQSKKVKQTIELALKNWVEHDYFCDNWWYNQIGTPNGMVTLMLIVGDELDKTLVEKAQPIIGRAHVDAPGARPGGDRIKIAGIQAKNALFLGDEEQFDMVVRVIESEIKYSDWVGAEYGYGFRHIPSGFSNRDMGGRGIQYDNSFHHRVDGVNNTLSYGLGYADAFVEWAVYTAGTQYSFAPDRLERLIDYFLDGICKTAVYGKFPDTGAKNRSISREGALRPYSASTAEKLLLTSKYRRDELQEIADIRNKGIRPTLSHATYFWHSEHFTFQRPDWFASVRMYSTRTHNMEQPYNSEGLFNHHRGDGANHLAVTGDEYYDIWPVYDYQKIPGATIMQKPEMPAPDEIQKLGYTTFVGAATDGNYGTAAFDFRSPHDPLIARKSWFFFDDEYVALGAGISCRNGQLPVATAINQSHLRGDVTLAAAGQQSTLQKGEGEYENVDWIFHDQVGYVFPEPTSVHLMNDRASGSWQRINQQSDSPKEEVNLDVFKLWLDHGARPSEETYAYIVVPVTTVAGLEQNTAKENISILANTPEVQAVRHAGLGMCQAVFYEAGEVQVTENLKLASATPGIVLFQQSDNGLRLTVSDPNRQLGKMLLTVSTRIEGKGSRFRAVWNEEEKVSEIVIDLPAGQYAGSSVTVAF